MRPEALLEAQEWLRRARRDHRIGAANLRGQEVFGDAAAFFAHQAAEKALKAFLVAHDHPFPKTHDLERLVEWCETIDDHFGTFLGTARTLNPYTVGFRYPGGPLAPEQAEAEQAVDMASVTVQDTMPPVGCPSLKTLRDRVVAYRDSGHIKNDGLTTSLLVKLDAAQSSLDKGNANAFQGQLNAFINEVKAQSGKGIGKLPAAESLIADALAVLQGCWP